MNNATSKRSSIIQLDISQYKNHASNKPDTAADTFGGNEIDRQQVRRYIQGC